MKVGIVGDFPEERWESMDLVAEMVTAHLNGAPGLGIEAVALTPRYRAFLGRLSRSRTAWNVDRLLNRRWTLPRGVRRAIRRERPDAIFVIDHSYAHVVPVARSMGVPVVVLCHDLDAFAPLIEPQSGWKNRLHRWFARPILEGLLMADHVITVSETVRTAFVNQFGGRYPAANVTTIPNGVAPEFLADEGAVAWPFHGLGDVSRPLVLHIGSTIPRKRIDLLLESVAILSKEHPGTTLVRVGGPLTNEQRQLAEKLGVWDRVREMPRLSREEIAELYRRVDVVLVTSDAEGFGLPVVEALSCGARVVVSDIPVLRETGGAHVFYARPGQARSFVESARAALASKGQGGAADTESRRAWLQRFRWGSFVEDLAVIVRRLVENV